jgi:hypothetical protein
MRGDGGHVLLIRRSRRLTGVGNVLDTRAFTAGRSSHAIADLRCVHVELCEGAAERIAMHTKLFGSFALVAFVMREHLEDVTFLELANGFRVGNTGAVHLCDESVQFALQGCLTYRPIFLGSEFRYVLIVNLTMQFDPIGCIVLELLCAVQNEPPQVMRYNEGYRMSPRKEIGCETRICDPRSGGEESRRRHHDCNADQAASCEAEDGPKEPIEEAEADSTGSATKDLSGDSAENHDSKGDQ